MVFTLSTSNGNIKEKNTLLIVSEGDGMQSNLNVLLHTTIGDLIRQHREEANLSLSQLAHQSGVDKAGISRIERGETKRPELRTVQLLADVLGIPYEVYVSHYIDVEQRPDVLHDMLMEAIRLAHIALISKVVLRFLESPQKDSYDLIEQLFHTTINITNREMKLELLKHIIDFSRNHGIQTYFSKGILHKYLIERDDFSKLDSTYHAGKNIIQYENFLSYEEKILLYYKLGVHAYVLRLYKDCIELCEQVIRNDTTDSFFKAEAFFALCNSHYYLCDYTRAKHYLEEYSKFSFPNVAENVRYMTGSINGKIGNTELAVTQLESFLERSSEYNFMNVVVALMELYLEKKDLIAIEKLLSYEMRITQTEIRTPYKRFALAYFHRLKGDYLIYSKVTITAFESYIKSACEYIKVSMYSQAFECLGFVTNKAIENGNIELYEDVLQKMNSMYSMLSKPN